VRRIAEQGLKVAVLSGGSDGIHGHSPEAGAVSDEMTLARATAPGFDPLTALATFDSYPMFEAIGDAIVPGLQEIHTRSANSYVRQITITYAIPDSTQHQPHRRVCAIWNAIILPSLEITGLEAFQPT
jgi:hypothetical protein